MRCSLTGTELPSLIVEITDLPQAFVFAICLEMTPCWCVLDGLKATLRESPNNLAAINDALHRAAEKAWDQIYVGPRSVVYLNLLRNNTLVGGERQGWLDTDFYDEWDFTSNH